MTLDGLIVSKLDGLAAGGVWHRLAPEGTVAPYLVFFQQAESNDYTYGRLSSTTYLFAVKCVVDGFDQLPAQQLDAQIRAALVDQLDGTTLDDGTTVKSCRRVSGIDYVEQDTGVYLQHRGGTYRVVVAV
jgi:hypothetical protein